MRRQSLTRVFEIAVAAVAALICLLLLALAGRSAMSRWDLMRNGIRATGVVIERKDDSLGLADIDSTALVVRFEVAPGQLAVARVSTGDRVGVTGEGTEVEIIYKPGNPKKAYLFPIEWGLPLVMLIVTLPMLLLSGSAVFLETKQWLSERRNRRGPNQLD